MFLILNKKKIGMSIAKLFDESSCHIQAINCAHLTLLTRAPSTTSMSLAAPRWHPPGSAPYKPLPSDIVTHIESIPSSPHQRSWVSGTCVPRPRTSHRKGLSLSTKKKVRHPSFILFSFLVMFNIHIQYLAVYKEIL